MKIKSADGENVVIKRYTSDMQLFGENGKEIKFKIRPIEPKIKPLVDALNATKLLETFSSCQGHFSKSDQRRYFDRNSADVRFDILPKVSEKELESFMGDLYMAFWQMDSPVNMDAYKKYTGDGESIYLFTLAPKDRFAAPSKKRKDIDEAIGIIVNLVKEFTKRKAKVKDAKDGNVLTE